MEAENFDCLEKICYPYLNSDPYTLLALWEAYIIFPPLFNDTGIEALLT